VQAIHPHFRLDHSSYEAKGLPATWQCALHRRDFRAKASSLIRPGNIGCPDCVEERASKKRKQKRADPDLERHLEVIQQSLGVRYARIYRMHCDGKKWEEIGAELGITNQGVGSRLQRIATVLSDATQRTTKRT